MDLLLLLLPYYSSFMLSTTLSCNEKTLDTIKYGLVQLVKWKICP